MGNLLDLFEHRANFSVTDPYFTEELRFVQPMGIRYTALQKMLMPFFTEVWIYLIITLLIVFAIDYRFFGRSLFESVRILLGGEILRIPFTNGARLILGTWIIALVIVRSAYQGALFDILQAQIRYQPIRTVADVTRFNRSIYGSVAVTDILQNGNVNLDER